MAWPSFDTLLLCLTNGAGSHHNVLPQPAGRDGDAPPEDTERQSQDCGRPWIRLEVHLVSTCRPALMMLFRLGSLPLHLANALLTVLLAIHALTLIGGPAITAPPQPPPSPSTRTESGAAAHPFSHPATQPPSPLHLPTQLAFAPPPAMQVPCIRHALWRWVALLWLLPPLPSQLAPAAGLPAAARCMKHVQAHRVKAACLTRFMRGAAGFVHFTAGEWGSSDGLALAASFPGPCLSGWQGSARQRRHTCSSLRLLKSWLWGMI